MARMVSLFILITCIDAHARAPAHRPGMYALSVNERGIEDAADPTRDFTLHVVIKDYEARRDVAGGTLRLPFSAGGETYFLVLREGDARIVQLDGYPAPALLTVTYPDDPVEGMMFRGDSAQVEYRRALDARGTLHITFDVAMLGR